MTEIVVQGEHYADADELNAAIEGLYSQMQDMPSDTPEHAALAAHIDRLEAALPEDYEPDSSVASTSATLSPVEEPDTDESEPIDAPPTHSLAEAAEGAELVCPLCGQDVPYPEVPPLDPQVERCPDCEGWGKTLTGSRVDGHVWRDCPGCQGSGYRAKPGAEAPQSTKVRAAAAPKWDSATWDAENEWWNPPSGEPPWSGAHWDHYAGEWQQ